MEFTLKKKLMSYDLEIKETDRDDGNNRTITLQFWEPFSIDFEKIGDILITVGNRMKELEK